MLSEKVQYGPGKKKEGPQLFIPGTQIVLEILGVFQHLKLKGHWTIF